MDRKEAPSAGSPQLDAGLLQTSQGFVFHCEKMEFEATETETARSTPSRREKSLGLLTMKFVSLLQQAADGRLDLKVVSEPACFLPH